jgi:hypothetical protein
MPTVDDMEVAAAAAEALPLNHNSVLSGAHYKAVPSWRSYATAPITDDDSVVDEASSPSSLRLFK